MAVLTRRFLKSGQYYVTDSAMVLETLVGSCVAVCVYNVKNRICGMNHFLLDRPGEHSGNDTGRFGSTSTEYILKRLLSLDPDVSHWRGQVFGGAAVINQAGPGMDVGANNIAAALEVLGRYRIRIVRQETGGGRGRKVEFNTETHTIEWRYSGDIPRKKKPAGNMPAGD